MAKNKLGWVPETTARQMCAEMVAVDLSIAQSQAFLRERGHTETNVLDDRDFAVGH